MSGTDERTLEIRRLIAESDKFVAEQRKLMAEAAKFDRERYWYPAAALLIAFAGGAGAAFISLLLRH